MKAEPPDGAPEQRPQRILIVGPCGAGKSTLARSLGERLGTEVYHLDAYYWQPGWQPTPDDEWASKVQAMIEQPRWIIDGTYSNSLASRMARADAVIHLDFPRWRCMGRVLKRVWQHHGRRRPDLGPGCPEKLDLAFLWYVWSFHKHSTPKIQRALRDLQPEQQLHILHTPNDVAQFLRTF